LHTRLADLLNTSVRELPVEMRQVGQELAFHLATDPRLHTALADATLQAAYSVDPARTASEVTHRVEAVRRRLLGSDVSRPLRARLARRSTSMRL
jgi:hypothetical protein